MRGQQCPCMPTPSLHVSAYTLMARRKVLSTFDHTSQIEGGHSGEREDYEAEREMKPRGSALSALTGM